MNYTESGAATNHDPSDLIEYERRVLHEHGVGVLIVVRPGVITLSEGTPFGIAAAQGYALSMITTKRLQNATQWRVTRGIHDARNRTDLTMPTDLVPDQFYDFEWKLMPEDHVFEEGHRIGVILVIWLLASCVGAIF